MVSRKEVTKQLKSIGFNYHGWGRTEVSELPHIILPDEEIYECVNGIYEGGFALVVATDVRVLLIDKKPLNYLTVEDMRYDMINEMDYNHRLLGAEISISSGGKNLHFRSYNKQRLRKLISHVQHCIAVNKKKESSHQDSQVSHLEQINKQLQTYLIAQYQYQTQLHNSSKGESEAQATVPIPPKPSNELADYLYAQSLLSQYNEIQKNSPDRPTDNPSVFQVNQPTMDHQSITQEDIYNDGVREVFGSHVRHDHAPSLNSGHSAIGGLSFNVNPSRIAFSKLPMALKQRRSGKAAGLISLKPYTIYN